MPIKFTTKGFIELWRGSGSVKVSQHSVESEAVERATADSEQTGTELYVLKYPNKELDLSRLTRVIRDVDATRPTTPGSFLATPVSATQINLSWTTSTDPQGATNETVTGVAGYRLYRNGSLRTTTTSLSFSDTGLTEYTLYSYYVTAIDGAAVPNESVASSTLTPRTLDATAPTAPVITASQTGQTSISVALTTPSTDAHSGVSTYRLEYKRTADSTWTLDSASLTAVSFPRSISGLTAATAYDTRCRATDVSGNVGSFSATSSATTQSSGTTTDVTTFTLTSNTTGTLPFSVGHAFKSGDIPSGQFIVSDLATFQADIRNRWPDGSVKFAVLSGRKALTSGVASTVIVRKTASNPGGSTIAESSLISLAPSVSMALSGFGTVTLLPLLGSPVRSILGVQMSEFHYRAAVGSDAHLVVWFFCRLYAGGALEIETCVENGYMKVASPVDKSYTATLTINGTTRYTASLNHRQRCRWFTVNWYDGSSGLTDFARVVPAHDHAYLRSTKLVPNYATGAAPSATYLNTTSQNISPMGNGNHQAGTMANPGASDHIGLLPRWEAAYCVTGDSRAYRATCVNSYTSNSWPVAYRDESTQRPLALTTRPNLDAAGWGVDPVVAGTTSNPNSFGSGTVAHMPSCGFTAYLLTGRWTHLETAAFWAARSHMEMNPTTRGLTSGNGGSATMGGGEDRGKAWHVRTVMQAAAIYPDSAPTAADALVRTDWLSALNASFTRWSTTQLDCPLGYISGMYNPGLYGGLPDLLVGTFQGYFMTQCVGYTWDLDILTTGKTAHQTVRDHFYKLPVGMLGDNSGWCYRRGPQFSAVMGSYNGSTITWFSNWGQAWDRAVARGDFPDDVSCSSGGTIQSGNWPDATSYGANLMPAISYAVEHGATGASAAQARMTGASNYAAFVADQTNATQWAVSPRITAMPSWYPAVGAIAEINSGTTIGSVIRGAGGNSYPGTDPDDIVEAWSGGALVYVGGLPYLVALGGGHGDASWNGLVKFGPLYGAGSDSPTWSIFLAASAIGAVRDAPTYTDGRQSSCHTYNNPVGVDDSLYMMATDAYYQIGHSTTSAYRFTPSGQTSIASNIRSASFGAAAHYNGKIYYMGANTSFDRLRIYDIASNTWTSESAADIAFNNYVSGAVDTTRGALLVVNDTQGVYWSGLGSTLSRATGKNAPSGYHESLVYDPDRDAFVSFVDNSTSVRELSASSLASGGNPSWTTRTFTGTAPGVSAGNLGTYGRFRYVPELKGYVVVSQLDGHVYFYRSA